MVLLKLLGLVLAAQASPLADPGLDRQITVRADAEPIHILLSKVAKATDVKVFAAPAVGQDRIILNAKDVPAKEVLQKISEHFDWSWRLTKDGLELWQTPAQKNAEQRALNEAILGPFRKWRQESIEALKHQRGPATKEEAAKINDFGQQLADQSAKYRDEYYGTPEQRKAWSAKQRQIEAEVESLARRVSPSWQLYDQIVAGLSDKDLLELEAKGRISIAYAPKGAHRPMSATARQKAETLVQAFSQQHFTQSSDRHLSRLLGMGDHSKVDVASVQNVRLDLKISNFSPDPVPRLSVERTLAIVDKSGNRSANLNLSTRTQVSTPSRWVAPPSKVGQEPDQLDTPLQANDALTSALGAGAKFQAEVDERFYTAGRDTFRSQGIAVVLNELAASANVNFISDCYDANRYLSVRVGPTDTARAAFLSLANANREVFTFANGWAAFRDPEPAVGRAYSIPSDRLLAFRDALVQPFSLEASSNAINLLTDWQISPVQNSIQSQWGLILRRYEGSTPLLRFWATMPRGAKRTLESGQSARLASLGQTSLAHLWQYMERQNRDFTGSHFFGQHLDAEDYAWAKENWIERPNSYRLDRDLDELLPNGPHQGATISLRRSQGTAFSVYPKDRPTAGLIRGAYSIIRNASFGNGESQFQIAPEERNLFTIDLSPELRLGAALTGYGKLGPEVYSGIADLPEDLRQRIEAERKAAGRG